VDRISRRFPRYSALLRLYPARYRKEYGEQMLQTLADMLDDPEQRKFSVWARTALDLPFSIIRQQITYTGVAMTTTPNYMKYAAHIGAWMLTPFFAIIIINSFSHQWLQRTVLWHPAFLLTWIVALPLIAAALNAAALLRWAYIQRRQNHVAPLYTLADLRRSWLALVITVAGIGIFSVALWHDSVHCVTGNPIRELHNPHQTLHCIQQR